MDGKHGKVKGKPGRKPQYTPEREQRLLELIASGQTITQACNEAGVGVKRFEVELFTRPDLADLVRKAKLSAASESPDRIVTLAREKLVEIIQGYEWDEVTTIKFRDPRSGQELTKTRTVHKTQPPSAAAIIYVLQNLSRGLK